MKQRLSDIARHIFVHNFKLKLLSLVLAVVLFVLVRADRVVERTVTLDVVVIDKRQKSRYRLSEIPTMVKVRLRSRITKLRGLDEMALPPLEVDISKRRNGDRFHFEESTIARLLRIPGVKIVEISPASFVLQFSKIIRRTLPVRAQFRGQVPNGYVRGPAQLKPPFVVVKGAEENVQRLRYLETQPIELSGNVSDLNLNIGLENLPTNFVEFETKTVSVTIPITPKVGKTRIRNVAVIVRNCNPDFICSARPKRVDVYVEGPELDVRKLRAAELERFIYIEGNQLTKPGEHRAQLVIRAHPDGLQFFTERTYFLVTVVDPRKKTTPPPETKPVIPQPRPTPRPLPLPPRQGDVTMPPADR
ncbi:MAG: YbbR-like domain-containing protein [Myxococcales bacterium]|nr:YbbR-like domain-containing protein [Myxococcales bacterium]